MTELEYSVCWSGNSWRDFPVQPTMPLPATETAQGDDKRYKPPSGRRKVLAALGASWASPTGIVGRTGLSRKTVDLWLERLIRAEMVDRLVVGSMQKRGGQPQKLYRRRSQEAA